MGSLKIFDLNISIFIGLFLIFIEFREKVNKTFGELNFFLNFIGGVPQEVEEIESDEYHHDDGDDGVLAGKVVGIPFDILADEFGHVFNEGEDELVLEQDEVVEVLGESVVAGGGAKFGQGVSQVVDGLGQAHGEGAFSKPCTELNFGLIEDPAITDIIHEGQEIAFLNVGGILQLVLVLINDLINSLIGLNVVSAVVDGVGVGIFDEGAHELDAGLRNDLEDLPVDAYLLFYVGVLVVQLDHVEDRDRNDEGERQQQLYQ
jgi:hypothetical protein